jgi:hypothetical protein
MKFLFIYIVLLALLVCAFGEESTTVQPADTATATDEHIDTASIHDAILKEIGGDIREAGGFDELEDEMPEGEDNDMFGIEDLADLEKLIAGQLSGSEGEEESIFEKLLDGIEQKGINMDEFLAELESLMEGYEDVEEGDEDADDSEEEESEDDNDHDEL